MKRAMEWQLQFDMDDIVQAKQETRPIITFWNTFQKPADRINLILMSHQVNITGRAQPTRRCHAVVLALVLAREKARKPLPARPAV